MINRDEVRILVNPPITPDQLWDFYVRNDICEVGFGKDTATIPLKHSSLIIGAFAGEKLVGITRAMFDGLSADIMEFSLELELQGTDLQYDNGSLCEKDALGVAKEMGDLLVVELTRMGAYTISYYVVENCEETVVESIGFRENKHHLVYILDRRPYVLNNQ